MLETIEHLANPERSLREIWYTLKRSGRLVITTPSPESGKNDVTHISLKSFDEWLRLLRMVGFKPYLYCFMPPRSKWLNGLLQISYLTLFGEEWKGITWRLIAVGITFWQ
jgi:SAM-dependent methyltransferase